MPLKRSTVPALWSKRVHRCGRWLRSCDGTDANTQASSGRTIWTCCEEGISTRRQVLAVANNDRISSGNYLVTRAPVSKSQIGRAEIGAGTAGFGKALFAGR